MSIDMNIAKRFITQQVLSNVMFESLEGEESRGQ